MVLVSRRLATNKLSLDLCLEKLLFTSLRCCSNSRLQFVIKLSKNSRFDSVSLSSTFLTINLLTYLLTYVFNEIVSRWVEVSIQLLTSAEERRLCSRHSCEVRNIQNKVRKSSKAARESVPVFIWRPLNVGITVAYLFNIVNEPQITVAVYFHNVFHCAACQSLRVFVCTSFRILNFMNLILFHLKFIKFELHNYGSRVCPFACMQNNFESYEQFLINYYEGVGHGQRRNGLILLAIRILLRTLNRPGFFTRRPCVRQVAAQF